MLFVLSAQIGANRDFEESNWETDFSILAELRTVITLRLETGSAAKGLQDSQGGQYHQQLRVDMLLHTQEVWGSSPCVPTI